MEYGLGYVLDDGLDGWIRASYVSAAFAPFIVLLSNVADEGR